MQLIPDAVKEEVSMSENDIIKMQSSSEDTIEESVGNDVQPSPKDGVHNCSGKDVMVVIDDSYLNDAMNPELKSMSEVKKELLEVLNNVETDTIVKEDTSQNLDSENISKEKIDRTDSVETTETILNDQEDISMTPNGIVKLEPVEDNDMPDAPTPKDSSIVNDKTQDVVSKNSKTNIDVANGIIPLPIQVKEEINPPAANHVFPLPIILKSVKSESPESVIEASDKPESDLKEIDDSKIPNNDTTEIKSTEAEETDITKTPSESDVNDQIEDLMCQKSSKHLNIKSIDTINKESEDSKNSCVVEKPISSRLSENSTSSVVTSEKSDTLEEIKKNTANIDILNLDSDDEMDGKEKTRSPSAVEPKECVSVNLDDEDDDDIMLVDDDLKETVPAATDKLKEIVKTTEDVTNLSQDDACLTANNSNKIVQSKEKVDLGNEDDDIVLVNDSKTVPDTNSTKENEVDAKNDSKLVSKDILNTESVITAADKDLQKSTIDDLPKSPKPDKASDEKKAGDDIEFPTLPLDFKISFKNNIGELSRDDLEEFCLVKIVEAIVARSNLSDVRLKLKMLQKNIEEWRKKVNDLTKQNKDLDTVVKAVSDLQKRKNEECPVPIKITRSVGLQVGFTCHPSLKPAEASPKPSVAAPTAKKTKQLKTASSKTPTPHFSTMPAPTKGAHNQNPQKKTTPVPVPRLVLASKSPVKAVEKHSSNVNFSPVIPSVAANTNLLKTALNNPSLDIRKPSAEKRPAVQSIDLTDDEPPAKQQDVRTFQSKVANGPGRPPNRPNIVTKLLQPVNRLSFIGNTTLMPNNRPMYLPINSNAQQQNNIGPNTTIMGPRKISPAINRQHTLVRVPGNNPPIRLGHSIQMLPPGSMRHPAPLPQTPVPKQLSHASWKWIPPRPNLKISKADNGIVISWEMDGYLDSRHEEVASYQIYAYQETSTPPNTDLWKKIGDVKSLPLPMACTLTKFMAGFKYYFAVRAVDVRSRVGPFSAPGQILLLNDK